MLSRLPLLEDTEHESMFYFKNKRYCYSHINVVILQMRSDLSPFHVNR